MNIEQYENLVENKLHLLSTEQKQKLLSDIDAKVKQDSFDLFIKYNMKDTNLVTRQDAKLGFIRQALSVAHMSKSAVGDIFGTVKPWDNMMYGILNNRGVQIPPKGKVGDGGSYIGGYVKAPILGRHEWVVSVDLASLYPSIIRMFNMSIETLRKSSSLPVNDIIDRMINMTFDTSEAKALNYAIAANGAMYDKSIEGVIPYAMTYLTNERKRAKTLMKEKLNEREKYKGENDNIKGSDVYNKTIHDMNDIIAMLDAQQQALKILANSGYGAIGNAAFRYYREEIAESITATGQLAIRYIANSINEFVNSECGTENVDYIIAIDTDSNYIVLNQWVIKNLDILNITKDDVVTAIDKYMSDVIEPFIEMKYNKLADYLNCDVNLLIMKREAIADAAVWRAKKNYIINVWDNEHVRYKTPQLKMMGIETSRTSTPMVVRNELTTCLKLIIADDEKGLKKEVENFKKMYYNLPVETIAVPRGVTDIDKWISVNGTLKSGTPMHVRAAINYNNIVNSSDEYKKRHEIIKNGSKIKYIKLLPNNPIGSHVVGYTDELPPEFGLHDYIDRKSLFEDTFMKPLESFTTLVNYSIRHNNEISSFFGSSDVDSSSALTATTNVTTDEPVPTKRKTKTYKQININDLFGA